MLGFTHYKRFSGIKAVCFDLFFTLADPHCELEHTESDPLGVSTDEWGRVNWSEPLASERGLGIIRDDHEIIRLACNLLSVNVNEEQMEQARLAKEERMKIAVTAIRPEIVETVRTLKERGYRIGLISNADVIDKMHWNESPLQPYFDDVIFSCDAGLLKPNAGIYALSLQHLGVSGKEAVFVGDGGSREHEGAKAMGMGTVCVRHLMKWPAKEHKEIRRNADLVLDRFSELLRYLP